MSTPATSTTSQADFGGQKVIAFESRLAEMTAQMLKRYGADPLVAPSMQEIPFDKNPEAFAFGEKLMTGKIHVLIALTGVGMRMLLQILETRYPADAIRRALEKITVIARGPKPVKVLRECQIPVAIVVPEPNTWREILQAIDQHQNHLDLNGKVVAVQEYGQTNEDLVKALKQRGAHVQQVPVYRWALPDDRAPLENAIEQILKGRAAFALFTSAQQIRHVLKVAAELGIEKELRYGLEKMVIASIGPTATETLRENGLSVDFEPSHPKLGHLVSELAKQAGSLLDEKRKGKQPSVQLVSRKIPDKEILARRETPFLKACRREKTPYTPVWLMRQAGRYMEEYRRVRNKVSFLELCKTKELAAEVTITAVERIKADAAIIFSDILLIVEPFGLELKYVKEEGPVIGGLIQEAHDVDRLPEVDPGESLSFVYEAIRLTRSSLNPNIPLIGFCGAPFTLAAYMVEGGSSRSFVKTKTLMYSDPGAWHALMGKLSRALIKFLKGQITAGADALQIFDSWVGCLSPSDYRNFVLPHTRSVIQGVQGTVPVIHFGTGTFPFLESMADAGGDVIGIDFHAGLAEAWQKIGDRFAIQGNLDPLVLCSSRDHIRKRAAEILKEAAGRPGHIFNLGHGILPQTPVENVMALIEDVHELSQK